VLNAQFVVQESVFG